MSWIEIRLMHAQDTDLRVQTVRPRLSVPPEYNRSVVQRVVHGYMFPGECSKRR